MTKTGVGFASALRRICVGHFVGPLLVVLSASGGAFAGAWEEFERRCLVPMENVTLQLAKDLVGEPAVLRFEDAVLSNYIFKPDDDELLLSYLTSDEAGIVICSVKRTIGIEAQTAAVRDSYLAWADRAKMTERYSPIDLGDGSWAFRTTQWREPKMNVVMRLDESFDGFSLSAEETDLES